MELLKFALKCKPELSKYKSDWVKKINMFTTEEWEIGELLDRKKLKTQMEVENIEPDHEFYPTGSYFWTERYLLWMKGEWTSAQIKNEIESWHNPKCEIGNNPNIWRPRNLLHLYWIYQIRTKINHIKTISAKIPVHSSVDNQSNVRIEKVTYAYDPLSNDIKMWYKTPVYRISLMSNLKEWYKLYKKNPIHCRENDESRKQNYKIHICQTRISKYFLMHFLEKITFINNKYDNGKFHNHTLMIKPGMFIWNESKKIYGLVMDIISENWSFKMHKNKINETTLDWTDRLISKIQQFKQYQQHSDQSSDIEMNPEYEIIILPLIYKYSNCKPSYNHNHKVNDELELCLKLNNSFVNDEHIWHSSYQMQMHHMYKQIKVDDEFCVGSIQIGSKYILYNPNDSTNCELPNDKFWYWKYIIYKDKAYSPLYFWEVIKMIVILTDPYASVIPGLGSPQDNVTCCLLQSCFDGFRVFKTDAGISGYTNLKENYVSPVHHLLNKCLISSIGTVYENANNTPFYKLFMEDVIRLMFKGIEIQIDNERTIHVFALLISILNDGKEIKSACGLAGPSNDKNDYFTTMRSINTLLDCLVQAIRHQRVLLTQKVCIVILIPLKTYVHKLVCIVLCWLTNVHKIAC